MRFRRSLSAAVAVAGLSAALVVAVLPAGPAAAEEVFERPQDGIYLIDGHGYGHARGMSQWGAQGAAGAGVDYTTILNSYYAGTSQTGGGTGNIRVLVSGDEGADTVVTAPGLNPGTNLTLTDTATTGHWTLPNGPAYAYWRITGTGGVLAVESSSDGASWTAFLPGGGATFAGPLQFDPPPQVQFTAFVPLTLVLPGGVTRDYRGAIQAALTGGSLVTVNSLTLEDYLRGVVPRATPSWFYADALRAQAVASRSLAVYYRDHAAAGAVYDICDTAACQVYGGQHETAAGVTTQYEQANTNNAVDFTVAVIRTYGGAAIFAEFSSSSGGFTIGSSTFPYLSAHPDPYDALDSRNTSNSWSATLPVATIEAAYPSLGRLTRVRIINRDGNGAWGGRVSTVILEGTDAGGNPTAVATDGTGFCQLLPWPANVAGLRSNWWLIRPIYDAAVAAISDNPMVVRPPAVPAPSYVDVTNTGRTIWDPASIHLTVASAPGSADRLTGDDRTPGDFIKNLSTGDGSPVGHDQVARIQVTWNVARVAAGDYAPSYRLMIGAATFGPTIGWKVAVREPVYAAKPGSPPTLAPAGTRPNFAPLPVKADGSVAVPRSGRTVVRLTFLNTSNLAWPLNGPVEVATGGPHNRRSGAYGPGWPTPTRAAPVSGVVGKPNATEVLPGDTGFADVTLWGNNRAVGTHREVFDLVWETKSWFNVPVDLEATVVDTGVPRAAELVSAPPAAIRLVDHPAGSATLTLRLRNVGATPWRVGGTDVLGVVGAKDRTPLLRTPAWISAIRATRLVSNVSRSDTLVYPGEVGEWRVPITAFKKAPGMYVGTLRAVDLKSKVWYGPSVVTRVTVVRGSFAGSFVGATGKVVVPRTGSQSVSVDVRNNSNFSWQVGGPIRLAVLTRAGSPSRSAGWLKPLRPSAIATNVTSRGLRVVRPAQVARFSFRLNGNKRKPGRYTETFGVVWEGWKAAPFQVTLTYTVR